MIDYKFESEKNRKAFLYTLAIMALLLLIAFFVKWQNPLPPQPIAQDLIEINLGNFDEGDGEVQPLIKGEKAPDAESNPEPTPPAPPTEQEETMPPPVEESDDEDAAPISKPVVKTTTPKPISPKPSTPVVAANPKPTPNNSNPTPKPQKPKVAGYGGPTDGKGNGATEDNGYKYQGKKPGGTGDAGDPNGNPDSYGKDRGGRTGGKINGPSVTKGDRKIVSAKSYNFTDELDKATIYAFIKVGPDGRGSFAGFDKGSTSRTPAYSSAIGRYLPSITFDKADHESIVTVRFNFNVN